MRRSQRDAYDQLCGWTLGLGDAAFVHQHAHMRLARQQRAWPAFVLPAARGVLTATDVLSTPAGPDRLAAIRSWCESVWEAYHDSRRQVIALLAEYGIV
ncbi:MAG TPA: hypothetical protein VMX54_02765 [Vicinamibacteria bacterium]|nr:hypothetical protein [Vicinamibacteria bacterium]